MTTIIIGIDPGAATGVAIFERGKLVGLRTIEPHKIAETIACLKPARVVFEDSRLQSHVWTSAKTAAAKTKMARNVGEIDAWCRLITAVCGDHGIPAHGISPKHKGEKLKQQEFAQVTGWAARCNQHERDAAMVAWPYRAAKCVATVEKS